MAAHGAEPVALHLNVQRAGPWRFAETVRGKGSLTRSHGGAEQVLSLEAEARGERVWKPERVETDGLRVLAESRTGTGVLRLTDAGLEYRRERPWRSFRLLVTALGTVAEAEPLNPAADLERGANEPPVDLDLGEVFTVLELGLLPPTPLEVGARWQLPAPGTTGGRATPSTSTVQGRLTAVEDQDGRQVALLDTTLKLVISPRPTPLEGLQLSGEIGLTARVEFDVAAGCVLRAGGPVTLALRYGYPDARGTVATVRLNLELATAALAAAPPATGAAPAKAGAAPAKAGAAPAKAGAAH